MKSSRLEDRSCYGFEGVKRQGKPCTNQAVWYWRITYDDPDILGDAYCQLCEACLQEVDPEKNKHEWRKLGEETTGLIT